MGFVKVLVDEDEEVKSYILISILWNCCYFGFWGVKILYVYKLGQENQNLV